MMKLDMDCEIVCVCVKERGGGCVLKTVCMCDFLGLSEISHF